jgi:predicted GNAT family acetyltransferase
MATLAEIKAERKEKLKAKKKSFMDKVRAASERTKKDIKARLDKRYKRENNADKRARLKADLKGEESLAQSRTFRGQGRGDAVADLKLLDARNKKRTAERITKRITKRESNKKLRDEGKTPNEIFKINSQRKKKPVVKKPVVKKPVVKKAKSTDPNRGNKVPGASSSEYMTRTPRPDFNATKVKKAGRNKALTDKLQKTVIDRAKKDSGSTLKKLFGASEEKRAMGRNQMNRARSSMGMKKGGMVKKCRMDGIALRGKTRAKERSK